MSFELRKATLEDQSAISALIVESVRGLSLDDYTPKQIELSVKSVFGVDRQLIQDQTYFAAVSDGKIVGCGGWSKRKTMYGASRYSDSRDPELLDPATDAAKIRSFFIHPDWSRMGVGSAILEACESEAVSHGFKVAEMMATLPGVKLYAVRGYSGNERVEIPVGEGISIDCIVMTKTLV